MLETRQRWKAWTEIVPAGRAFVKMHGLRNHFVIVDGRDTPYAPGREEIVTICDPQIGIGGDQLVIVEPPTPAGRGQGADAFMRILNIDGREAEACGNAMRCVAYLLLEETGEDVVRLETLAGTLACRRHGDLSVSAEMGRISMDWRQIPLAEARDCRHLGIGNGALRDPVALNIGNPHAVFFVDDLDAVDIESLAPAIQCDPLFPAQVNVGVAEMTGPRSLRLAVYERPGILTTACGSGACVAVQAARVRGLTTARRMTVEMPAGAVEIEIRDDDTAVMTGPVAVSFGGHLPA